MEKFDLVPLRRKSFYGKAKVIVNNGVATLRSYTTNVATYDIKNDVMTVKGWWSDTTARHINAFLSHYGKDTMSKAQMQAFE